MKSLEQPFKNLALGLLVGLSVAVAWICQAQTSWSVPSTAEQAQNKIRSLQIQELRDLSASHSFRSSPPFRSFRNGSDNVMGGEGWYLVLYDRPATSGFMPLERPAYFLADDKYSILLDKARGMGLPVLVYSRYPLAPEHADEYAPSDEPALYLTPNASPTSDYEQLRQSTKMTAENGLIVIRTNTPFDGLAYALAAAEFQTTQRAALYKTTSHLTEMDHDDVEVLKAFIISANAYHAQVNSLAGPEWNIPAIGSANSDRLKGMIQSLRLDPDYRQSRIDGIKKDFSAGELAAARRVLTMYEGDSIVYDGILAVLRKFLPADGFASFADLAELHLNPADKDFWKSHRNYVEQFRDRLKASKKSGKQVPSNLKDHGLIEKSDVGKIKALLEDAYAFRRQFIEAGPNPVRRAWIQDIYLTQLRSLVATVLIPYRAEPSTRRYYAVMAVLKDQLSSKGFASYEQLLTMEKSCGAVIVGEVK